jgi:hypothetical protein
MKFWFMDFLEGTEEKSLANFCFMFPVVGRELISLVPLDEGEVGLRELPENGHLSFTLSRSLVFLSVIFLRLLFGMTSISLDFLNSSCFASMLDGICLNS